MEVKNILDFPSELLELILKRIEWEEVVSCETICKKFSQAARRSMIDIHVNRFIEVDKLVEVVTKYGGTLLDLDLGTWPKEHNRGAALCNATTRLTRLTLLHRWIRRDGELIGLSKLSALRYLEINQGSLDTETLNDVLSLTKLTRLSVARVSSSFAEKLTKLSNIVDLRIEHLTGVEDEEKLNFLTTLTNIRALSWTDDRLDLSCAHICQLSHLTSLTLHAGISSNYPALTKISRLDRLERLTLFASPPTELAQLTQLTRLKIALNDANVKLLSKFQRLKAINCFAEGDGNFLLHQLRDLPNLEKIVVTGLAVDCNFDELTACSKLTCLRVSCSSRLNIMAAEEASNLQRQMHQKIARLTALKDLEVDYYDTIEPLIALTNLQSLRIYACYRQTPVAELAAVKHLPHLNKFFFDTIDAVLSAREIKRTLFAPDSHVQVSVAPKYM